MSKLDKLYAAVVQYLMSYNQLEQVNCSESEFMAIAGLFKDEYVDQAFESLRIDEWERDPLLMAFEGGFKGWFWTHKESYTINLKETQS